MPEAVIIDTQSKRWKSPGKFPVSNSAVATAAVRWRGAVQSARLKRSMPIPENVVLLSRPAADWPVPPHVLSMMHLTLQLNPEQAAKVAGQLAAIYALSGDAFTNLTIKMLEEIK